MIGGTARLQCAWPATARVSQTPRAALSKLSSRSTPSVEQIYQRKSQIDHILLRPDAYIGSCERVRQTAWLYNRETGRMLQREIEHTPGLYKIFDELLVNAADNKQRDSKMNSIRINICHKDNSIEIWNNGRGVPVVEHKREGLYVPSLIFGHLLTSSNFDDNEKKTTGGRNGFGAKLCNVYSSEFTVETSCSQSGKSFQQTWTENMTKASEVIIGPCANEDFTRIRFKPDLKRFNINRLDEDAIALFSRRAVDLAGTCSGVKVYLNEQLIPVSSFSDYWRLYLDDVDESRVASASNGRWEVAVCLSNDGFQQVSFVNSIATTKGGRHVDLVCDAVLKRLADVVDTRCRLEHKKLRGLIRSSFMKNHLWLFCNCLIENPSFDSQTKEFMTLQPKSFGSQPQLDEKFFKRLVSDDCGIVPAVLEFAELKTNKVLNQRSRASKSLFHEKLDDANNAGRDPDCVLILTEGDSAKSLAVAGASSLPHGRDKFGVFPLKGKLLNVREANKSQLMNNKEIKVIQEAVNLQYGKRYLTDSDMKSLRYRHLMIMADQDQDGSHIKGLVLNFIHYFWPELLHRNFLLQFITPIVKASWRQQELAFYSLPEFEHWRQSTRDSHRWRAKYYKGLGTSTASEGRDYFRDMHRHCIEFVRCGEADDAAVVLAFGRDADARKEWLAGFMAARRQEQEQQQQQQEKQQQNQPQNRQLSLNEFVHKELVQYSNADNERSIPSLVDGLKPGQRKVLYACFKRRLQKEIKVSQLAGSVSELSAYHHGEASLIGSIVGLAQDFVGSNNINLLQPIGQFGSRLQGGRDAAAARYIHTCLSPLANVIFNSDDEPLLKRNRDDNLEVEPLWYVPIIPLVLVNGADGIGTGWSTRIPNYSVHDIVANLRRMLNGEKAVDMLPSYRGFKGEIRQVDAHRYLSFGEVRAYSGSNVLEITELPLRVWSEQYQDSVLKQQQQQQQQLAADESKSRTGRDAKLNDRLIENFNNYCSDTDVRFMLQLKPSQMQLAKSVGLHRYLKLYSSFSTNSMVLFDCHQCLRRYESPLEILQEYFHLRLSYYAKRKANLMQKLTAERLLLENQSRFMHEISQRLISIEQLNRQQLHSLLKQRNYSPNPMQQQQQQQQQQQRQQEEAVEEEEESEQQQQQPGGDFDYILRLPLWSLTSERQQQLQRQHEEKLLAVRQLEAKSPSEMWLQDLDQLVLCLDKLEADHHKRCQTTTAAAATSKDSSKASTVAVSLSPRAGKQRSRAAIPIPKGRPIVVQPS